MKINSSTIERIPLYVRVSGALKSRINSLDWNHGNCIPSIEELCSLYGVSRNTMRQALDLLQREGLIKSTRGRGTVVVQMPTEQRVNQAIADAINNPFTEDSEISIKILGRKHRVDLPDHIAGENKCYPEYTLIRKLHLHDGTPFAYIDLYVAFEHYAKLPKRADEQQILTRLLTECAGIFFTSWWEEITVEYPDERIASQLGCSMLNPVVLIKRSRFDQDRQIVLGGDFYFRSETFVLTMSGKGPRAPNSNQKSFWNFDRR